MKKAVDVTGEDLQAWAAERALELPGSELTHPFGEDWDVFKVRGKVFLLLSEREDPFVTVKAHPDDSVAMRQMHPSITPGYHMNKRHWVTVHAAPDIDANLVAELVTDYYLLVVAGLPQRQRPVDPATFGASGSSPARPRKSAVRPARVGPAHPVGVATPDGRAGWVSLWAAPRRTPAQ